MQKFVVKKISRSTNILLSSETEQNSSCGGDASKQRIQSTDSEGQQVETSSVKMCGYLKKKRNVSNKVFLCVIFAQSRTVRSNWKSLDRQLRLSFYLRLIDETKRVLKTLISLFVRRFKETTGCWWFKIDSIDWVAVHQWMQTKSLLKFSDLSLRLTLTLHFHRRKNNNAQQEFSLFNSACRAYFHGWLIWNYLPSLSFAPISLFNLKLEWNLKFSSSIHN